ncbi:patatin family protein [Lentilactobacillus curieae]|uniref:Patatin family protein n=1 Tax=Lentilactobacillus curieae TaxID=1138822 RepID=A0A1S6QII5_9LACO|nr:patatin family protein [Lentilactobacillus curieae]AQW21422.1 patatin family protein [Lentilactobacillus curieae]
MNGKINYDKLPSGIASNVITKGCLIIEGGAFRGVYAQGVTDCLMEHNFNFECTVGCSAGALTGMNYVSGQIGRAIRINLAYRHDSRYVGLKAIMKNNGLIGFDFVLNGVNQYNRFDTRRFLSNNRRFVAVATDIKTGKPRYFDKAMAADYQSTIQASASMPFVSKPVAIEDSFYLDGGITDSIPYQWAINHGYEKVIVVRTREDTYRKNTKKMSNVLNHSELFKEYPALGKALNDRPTMYNRQCDTLDRLVKGESVFRISPSEPVTVGRLESNISKLEELYWFGYQDAKKQLTNLYDYLKK